MTDTSIPIPSLADRVRPLSASVPVVGVHFLGATPVFVLGEEVLLFAGDVEHRVSVHAGGILASAADETRIVTGGDDGDLVETDARGEHRVLFSDGGKRWIDQVSLGPDGAVAWSAGKVAYVRTGKGEDRQFEAPSTVAGLSFAPKGFRVAIAHYNGATLWFPNTDAQPERLEWKGSHLGITISPDGKFLITSMQEPMLHGWRLSDRKHMRMSGYSARVRSLDWSADGKWLASAGAEQLILWSFQSKDGPMGKEPRMLAPYPARAVIVSCHPNEPVVAVGYADGLLLLVRVEDGAEILAKKPGAASVTALGWRADGAALAFGTEDGEAGVIDLA